MVHVRTRRSRGEDGVIAIFFAIVTCFVLFGISALVVDLGFARDTKQASQIASDASALAAATALYPDNTGVPNFVAAVAAAKSYAEKNFGVDATTGWTGCADPGAQPFKPDAGNACISFDAATSPTKVRVVMPHRTIGAGFGAAYGVSTYTISTSARAVVASPVSGSCALCFLGSVNTNNTDFTVQAASIAVDGNITSGPQSNWSATSILVAGTVNGVDPDTYTSSKFTPDPTGTPPFADPYNSLVLPAAGGTVNTAITNCNTTLLPGVYGSVSVGNGTCTLAPGLYVITGAWTEGSNNSKFTTTAAGGVTLFFTCGTPTAVQACTASTPVGTGGYYDGKNGDTILKAGAPGYPHFALIYDRQNPNPIYLQGNGDSSITGAVYAPKATMEFNGNSAFVFNGGPIVVGGADSVGNQSGITVVNGQTVDLTSDPSPASLDR